MKLSQNATFLLLILVQGLHSLEEYIGQIWLDFPPATILCRLVSRNLEQGFLIINIGLFLFGLFCWIFLVRTGSALAKGVVWFWVVIGLVNGIGYPLLSILQGGYLPGTWTATVLLTVAVFVARSEWIKSN